MKKTKTSFVNLLALLLCLMAMPGMLRAEATAVRLTPLRDGVLLSVTAAETIYAGSMVAVSNTTAYNAADVAGYTVVGRAENSVVSGDVFNVRRGVFRWENEGTFSDAYAGDFAYVYDNESVTTAAGASNDIIAGIILAVDTDGVWVDCFQIPAQGAASLASLAVSGNATITGVATLTAAPVLVATTSATDVSATMTNAPALVAAASPAWPTVTIDGEIYVIPAFQLDD